MQKFFVGMLVLLIATASYAQDALVSYRGTFGETIIGLGTLNDIDFSPDGKHFTTAGSQGVFVWDLDALEQPVLQFPLFRFIRDAGGVYVIQSDTSLVQYIEGGDAIEAYWENAWHTRALSEGLPFTTEPYSKAMREADAGIKRDLPSLRNLGRVDSPIGGVYAMVESSGISLNSASDGSLIYALGGGIFDDAQFTVDGSQIVASDLNANLTFWSVESGEVVMQKSLFPGNEETRFYTKMVPGRPWAAVFDSNDVISFINYETNETIATINAFSNGNVMALSPDGRWAFRINGDDDELISLETLEVIHRLTIDGYAPACAAFSLDSQLFAVAVLNGDVMQVKVWQVESGEMLLASDFEAGRTGNDYLQISRDKTRLLYSQLDHSFVVELASGDVINTINHDDFTSTGVTNVTADVDLNRMAAGRNSSFFSVDLNTGDPLCISTLDDYGYEGRSIAFAPNGFLVTSDHRNGYVVDVQTCDTIAQFRNRLGLDLSSFTRDSRWMVSAYQTILVYDLEAAPPIDIANELLSPAFRNMQSIALTDEDIVVVGNDDGTVVMLDLNTQSQAHDWGVYQ
ncbi:WD40 repeat domain-containing protein [bacterium]|nr:WD40 repeat domain-containing protein [bacterium]